MHLMHVLLRSHTYTAINGRAALYIDWRFSMSIVAVSIRPDNLQHHGGAGGRGVEMNAEENE